MKQFKRLYMATAIAAAVAGGMAAAPQVSAGYAVDADSGNMLNTQLGTVLLYPYYTVRNDADGNPFRTSFTITNTSPTHVAIVKFRLRDHVNSEDVLDFMFALSPGDEVIASMDRDANSGQPRVNIPTDDDTCRIPNSGNQSTYSYVAPGGDVPMEDAQEGHLEVITMMMLPATSDSGALAVHGSSQNCASLQEWLYRDGIDQHGWTNGDGVNFNDAEVAQNVLRGSWAITSPASGFSAAGEPIVVANWGIGAGIDSDLGGGGSTGGSPFFYAQNGNLFSSNAGYAGDSMITRLNGADDQQWDHPHLGDSVQTGNLDAGALTGTSFINNWSTNPGNGVGIDWVVAYVTKHLYEDINEDYGGGGATPWPDTTGVTFTAQGAAYYDVSGHASPWNWDENGLTDAGGTDPIRCIQYTQNDFLVDREENYTGSVAPSGGGISPGTPDDPEVVRICNEINVLSFSKDGVKQDVLGSPDALTFTNPSSLSLPYGWADVIVVNYDGATYDPVAAAGFSYSLRNLGDPTLNFGAARDHTRGTNQPSATGAGGAAP